MIEIATIIISLFALTVSIAGYYFNLKLHNQNKLFDEKVKAYGELVIAFERAGNVLVNNIYEGKDLREEKTKGYKDDLDDLALEIDEAINDMFDALMLNIIILPKEIYENLDDFATFLDSDENYDIFENPKRISSLEKEIRNRLDSAIAVMRNDLQSDKLNKGLHKRLIGKNIGHKIFGVE